MIDLGPIDTCATHAAEEAPRGVEQAQRTLDWHRARLGHFTGSQVGKLMRESRQGGFSDTAMSYVYQVAATRSMNERVVESDTLFADYLEATSVETRAMRWGNGQEDNARRLYARLKGYRVEERGSVEHPTIPYFASSPDGWIADDGRGQSGCLEIKCPGQDTYTRYRAEVRDNETLKRVKPDYYWQCQAHMMCSGASWCDFVAYCPWQARPIHVVRILPSPDDMDRLEERVRQAEEIIKTLDL